MGGRSVRSLKETCMILHASQYAHKTNQHASRKPYHILQHSQRQKHPISVQNVTERHTIVIQVGFKMIALCGVCNVNVNDRETYLTIYVHVQNASAFVHVKVIHAVLIGSFATARIIDIMCPFNIFMKMILG